MYGGDVGCEIALDCDARGCEGGGRDADDLVRCGGEGLPAGFILRRSIMVCRFCCSRSAFAPGVACFARSICCSN